MLSRQLNSHFWGLGERMGVRDTNFGVIDIEMLLKSMRLVMITREVSGGREEDKGALLHEEGRKKNNQQKWLRKR